jgi:anti-anti-sigma factor
MFSYELVNKEDKIVIMFNGDMDIEITEIVEEEIIPSILACPSIDINLLNVSFVDSTGIGLLINLIDTVKKKNEDVSVTIINVQPHVKDIFELIQLSEILGENVFV